MVGRATGRGYSYGSAAVALALVLAVGLAVAGAVALVTNSGDGLTIAQEDTDEAFSGTSDLGDAETRFLGNDTGDKAGYRVAAGDVNGDGERDVLVSTPFEDGGGEEAGAVYLFYGPVDAGDLNVTDADVTFHGAEGDRAGWAIAAGDLDGDDDSDVVVGAPYDDGAGNDSGAVYVVHGGEDLPERVDLPTDANATYRGADASDEAGYAVATVRGNDSDALLVGAPYADTTDVDAGAAYLLENATAGERSVDEAANVTYAGASVRDQAGWSVADAGDFTGDGRHEVVVASPFNHTDDANYTGAVSILSTDYDDGESIPVRDGRTYDGVGEDDRAGWAVSTAGDVNDDGHADVAVGAPYNDSAAEDSGAAYVVHGGEDLTGDASLGDADVVLHGEAEGDRAGWSVADAGSGDVDCNGDSDVLVGATHNDTNSVNAGAAYLVAGDCPVKPTEDDVDRPTEPPRGPPAGPADTPTETPAEPPTETPEPTPPNASITTGCVDGETNRVRVTAANLRGENVTVEFDSENDSADFDRTLQPDANGTVDEAFDVGDGDNLTVTVYLGDDAGGVILDEAFVRAGACDATAEPGPPTVKITTACQGDQTNRIHVYAENLSGENVTIEFDSENDSADFTETVQPAANGTVHEHYVVTDEDNLTVTVYLGDDTSGDVLDAETFRSGACDVFDGPAVDEVQVETDCVDDRGRLTLENRNDGVDLRVVVADENGSEVHNGTLRAASTEVIEDLANGTYTVVTRFDGEEIGEEGVEVDCQPDDGGQPAAPGPDELEAVDVVSDCGDDWGSIGFTNPNPNDSVDVVITEEVGLETVNTTLAPGESDTVEDLPDRNYTVVTTADGERLGEEVVRIACEPAEPGGSGATDGNPSDADNGTDITNETDGNESDAGPPDNETDGSESDVGPPDNGTDTDDETDGNQSDSGPPDNGTDDGDEGDAGNESDGGDTDTSDSDDGNQWAAAGGGDQDEDGDEEAGGSEEDGDEVGGEEETADDAESGDGGDGDGDDNDGADGGDDNDGADGGGSSAENADGSGDGGGDENSTG